MAQRGQRGLSDSQKRDLWARWKQGQPMSEIARARKLHTLRHTYASMALAAGKSVRWVADPLGQSSPMLTLETYAHVMREEEEDLSFAMFGDGAKRLYPAPNENGAGDRVASPAKYLVELGGIEPPTLRLPA